MKTFLDVWNLQWLKIVDNDKKKEAISAPFSIPGKSKQAHINNKDKTKLKIVAKYSYIYSVVFGAHIAMSPGDVTLRQCRSPQKKEHLASQSKRKRI